MKLIFNVIYFLLSTSKYGLQPMQKIKDGVNALKLRYKNAFDTIINL